MLEYSILVIFHPDSVKGEVIKLYFPDWKGNFFLVYFSNLYLLPVGGMRDG